MAIPAKSKYVMDARPAPRAGLTLFCAPVDINSLWARIVLAEKEIDGARIEWVAPGKPHHDLLVLNPGGTLPTLVDRDTVLYPAAVVAEYLDERYPHPRLLPVDPAMRARLRMLLRRFEQDLFPLANDILATPKSAEAKTARKRLAEQLVGASALLPARGWCLGLEFNLADCAFAALLLNVAKLDLKLPADGSLARYAERLLARPRLAAALR
jgi:RNA polymerase-associated protein